ncbi:SUMF1/EgtB/PvdO family nonheme iron enzyme [Paracoccus sp. S3-43]|uniref:SUMF1/EgtB/PvdO family nonheme iron enzyme n=1 Tax=Paracoccus sp. S3-43 TaxID=3030011 RepID=UPI0023AF47AC|nr:SUMF1/EgtB/PvdO family nonheme iron enzyme [Paracoccus sp. S3-43]WEF24809.1 SUMF1/EgtB/PvdO family nonheme iron enzyme [Paracoccus sp. S3-43]
MHATVVLLAGAVAGALGLSLWPLDHRAAPDPARPDLPRMVRLDPQPFEHRLDGDWRQAGRSTDAPVQVSRIPAPVEIMETAVSTGQWQDCVAAGACLAPGGPVDRPDLPVTGVSWLDAVAYADWLSAQTGQVWRLPADVEWAYAATEMFRDDALGLSSDPDNPAVRWLAEYAADAARSRELDREIRPVGSLNVNSKGVRDIGGAVWEWTSTCLRRVDQDASGAILRQDDICGIYIVEGLHRAAVADFVRDPNSGGCSVGVPPANLGFRLVREIAG